MLLNFHERVPQKGKYNLYYTFGKGYLNEIKGIREHYGAVSSFSNQRAIPENPLEELPFFLQTEHHSLTNDLKNRTQNLNQSTSSFKNHEETLNRSRTFDKFLKKPTFEVDPNGIIQDKNTSFKPDVTLSSSLKQSILPSKIRFGSSNRRERFENLKLDKKFDFPGEYSDVNFMVTRENMKNQKAVGFYKDNFEVKAKNFDVSMTNLPQNVNRLTTPLEKRQEIQEVKKNKEKYIDWKRDFMNSQKKYRITKSSFRSGILDIDNPQNELTKVYQKEYEDFKKKEAERSLINERHKEQLKDFTKTHHDITFLNKNHKKHFNDDIKEIKISTNWTGKSRIKEKFYKEYQDSQDRLFGAIPNKYSVNRAENIMNCENKGKNWDIISWKINDFKLKVDKGVK